MREHTHTYVRPHVSRTEWFPTLDIYTSIYIYTRDARVSQSTRWCIEEARAIKRHVLLLGEETQREKEKTRRREINRNSRVEGSKKKGEPVCQRRSFPPPPSLSSHRHVTRLVLQGIVIHALRADPELASVPVHP